MNPRLKASRAAIDLIKRFEGFRPASGQLADGRWTIGHGHTRTAREGVAITEADAEALLIYDLIEVQAAVNDAVQAPINQNQFDALVSFVFNVGVENFRCSSVLRRLNAGDLLQAACALEMWRKADVDGDRLVADALVRRRSLEKALFLTPENEAWRSAPSPVVRPRVDYDVAAALPLASADVTATMHGDRANAIRIGDIATAPGVAVTAAAEAVAERLRALDLAEAEAGLDLEPPAASSLARDADPTPAAAFPDAEADAPRLDPSPEPEENAVSEEPLQADADNARRIAQRETPPATEGRQAGPSSKIGDLRLLGLGFLGLALFAGSVFWGVDAKGSNGLLDPMPIASVLGFVGILLVAGAVYFLLVNLSDHSDER